MKFSIATVLAIVVCGSFFKGGAAESLRRRATNVCSPMEIAEFDCDIMDDVVGVYVCRAGSTICVDPSDTVTTDSCGCCIGDNRPECIDDGDLIPGGAVTMAEITNMTSMPGNMTNATSVTTVATVSESAGGICSAAEVMEFDCDIVDDVVGVFVCRAGATTCVLASDTAPGDACGCCPGNTSPGCVDDGDSWIPNGNMDTTVSRASDAAGICSAFQLAEFDCDIVDDVVGVFVCRGGSTACVLASDTMVGDSCGCCPGDTSPGCVDDDDSGAGDDGWDDDM